MNIDHVVPRSRGGASSWETRVLSHRSVNEKKANRLAHEAGLRLLRKPDVPRALPVTLQLEVNRVAFRRESGLVDDFRHRRMRVDGRVDFRAGEFLVEREAHFGDELGGVLADDVRA